LARANVSPFVSIRYRTMVSHDCCARALLGHARIETTQLYAKIRPLHLKHTVAFYEEPANRLLSITLPEQKAV
jgi:hypothetical protein